MSSLALLATQQADEVDAPSLAYQAMVPRWDKIDALMGGTEEMRRQARKYLPDFEGEDTKLYDQRIERSFLIPATSDTIGMAVSKPFSKPVNLATKTTLPELVNNIFKDADLGGRSLHEFARDVHEDAVRHGKTHILVEMPVNPDRTIDKRPYFVHYTARDVFAWRSEKDPDTGEKVLTHVRMFEHVTTSDGVWGEKTVRRIRVLDAPLTRDPETGKRVSTTQSVFEEQTKDGKKTWVPIGEPTTIDFPGIPLVTIYHNRTGFMVAVPPFDKLASLNIEHWQSASDQKNILHVARVPILVEEGVETDEQRALGAGQRIQIDVGAKIYYAEHTGAAIAAGQIDLDKIEERMANAGHQMFVKRERPQVTATGENLEAQKETSELQEWIMATSKGFFQAFEFVVIWENLSRPGAPIALPDDFVVEIFSDFAVNTDPQDAAWLLNSVNAGRITPRRFLMESVRRGSLSESMDIDAELSELEAMGPPPGMVGLDEPPPDPEPDPEPEPEPDPDE